MEGILAERNFVRRSIDGNCRMTSLFIYFEAILSFRFFI